GYPQTNRKIDTGKTLTRWPVFVDHFMAILPRQFIQIINSQGRKLQH
ncbi:peptidase M16, partial [Shigella flexneri]|nr:peptidase M16 [Shigella flexneri]EFX7808145.1 insulinase family protein [Shigella flexneri]EFY1217990.1 insulinase family protein [Shigella flexneri]EGD7180024.1 insulinase family protein [Shigella flexneri]EGD7640250.1 insulinase family protein [Shigella flexneri]